MSILIKNLFDQDVRDYSLSLSQLQLLNEDLMCFSLEH